MFIPSDPGDAKRMQRTDFRRFRPLEAFSQPGGRQKTTQDEKPVPGKVSGPPGTPWDRASKKIGRADVWVSRTHARSHTRTHGTLVQGWWTSRALRATSMTKASMDVSAGQPPSTRERALLCRRRRQGPSSVSLSKQGQSANPTLLWILRAVGTPRRIAYCRTKITPLDVWQDYRRLHHIPPPSF